MPEKTEQSQEPEVKSDPHSVPWQKKARVTEGVERWTNCINRPVFRAVSAVLVLGVPFYIMHTFE